MAVVFRGWVIKVETVINSVSGHTELRITKPDVAAIIPMIDKHTILFEWHYRSATGMYMLELPAGHVNKGETPIHAARRELLEETGYTAGNIRRIYSLYMAPGLLADRTHFFMAKGLRRAGRPTDLHEKVQLVHLSVGKAYRYVKSGRINDGKSIIGVMHCVLSRKAGT